jgi:two-component system, sensor histidine kinase
LRKRRRGGIRRVKRLYGVLVRILVCDDNVDSANTWAALLDSEGHDVRISHFGTGCVQEALTWGPQAALVDIGLPGMDGYAVARALRASPGGAAILLIAVAGYSRPQDPAGSLQLRPDRPLIASPSAQRLQPADTYGAR